MRSWDHPVDLLTPKGVKGLAFEDRTKLDQVSTFNNLMAASRIHSW